MTLWAQGNKKLLQQLKTDFKRTNTWKKYQSEITLTTRNRCLNNLIDPVLNRLSVSSFKNDAHRRSHMRFFFPTVEIKDYNVMIDSKSFFDQPAKNGLITCENIQNIEAGQGDAYTTGCFLDYK